MAEEENLRQSPSETSEESRSNDKAESKRIESGLACHHHHYTNRHCSYDDDQFERRGFETEKESKEKNESECR